LKILITGLGITGKSTFRKLLYSQYANTDKEVVNLDLDYDRARLPKEFVPKIVYILEDVHGPTANAVVPLKEFDLVYYLLPSWWTHLRFWLSRIWIWFKIGYFAWEADKGERGEWLGTCRPYDLANIFPILKEFWHHFKNRGLEIKKDLAVLKASKITTIIIIPQKKWRGIKFYGQDLPLRRS